MSNTEHKNGLRQLSLAAERQLKKATERLHQQILQRKKPIAKPIIPNATPSTAVRLSPLGHTINTKTLTKADILRFSKNLRKTHLPNDLALSLLQLPASRDQIEHNKKLLAARETFKKRWQVRQHYLKYSAAEEEFERERSLSF